VAAPTGTAVDATATPSVSCSDAAQSASAYLVRRLDKTDHHLMSSLAGSTPAPDYSSTAWAVLSLADNGWTTDAKQSVQWLQQNGEAWTQGSDGKPSPAALALLILDSRATGTDPHAFGTTDLVTQLESTGPTPAATTAADSSSAAAKATTAAAKSSSSSSSYWWIFGVVLVAAIGAGILFSYNRAKGRRS
jgi:hypothetical protein